MIVQSGGASACEWACEVGGGCPIIVNNIR
jgi:hypothetical protein